MKLLSNLKIFDPIELSNQVIVCNNCAFTSISGYDTMQALLYNCFGSFVALYSLFLATATVEAVVRSCGEKAEIYHQ